MQQSDSGDNQQATVSEAEKGWLAGLIDGEGSLHIDLDPREGSHPYLTTTNTNKLITEKTVELWHRLGVGCRVQTRTQNNPNWNVAQDVMVIGHKRIKKALIAIMPYLVGKADQALLLYTFVVSRLLNYDRRTNNEAKKLKPDELAIIQILKDAKQHHKVLRDYTLNNQKVDDIVRATRRRVEAGRNAQSRLIGE